VTSGILLFFVSGLGKVFDVDLWGGRGRAFKLPKIICAAMKALFEIF